MARVSLLSISCMVALAMGFTCCSSGEQCELECPAPTQGCRYEGGRVSGECGTLSCGRIVCDHLDAGADAG